MLWRSVSGWSAPPLSWAESVVVGFENKEAKCLPKHARRGGVRASFPHSHPPTHNSQSPLPTACVPPAACAASACRGGATATRPGWAQVAPRPGAARPQRPSRGPNRALGWPNWRGAASCARRVERERETRSERRNTGARAQTHQTQQLRLATRSPPTCPRQGRARLVCPPSCTSSRDTQSKTHACALLLSDGVLVCAPLQSVRARGQTHPAGTCVGCGKRTVTAGAGWRARAARAEWREEGARADTHPL